MSLFFNSAPFWNAYDALDTNFFGDNIRVSPRAVSVPKKKEDKAVSKSDKPEDSLLGFVNNSIFKPDFDIVPPVDLIEKKDHFEIRASVPGVSPDELKLDYDDETNEIVISGEIAEHKVESEDKEKHKSYRELQSGSFERRIRFGAGVKIDADNISAGLKNGILDVTVPKVAPKEGKKTKRIAVNHSE